MVIIFKGIGTEKRIKNVIDQPQPQPQPQPGVWRYLGLFCWLESVVNRMGAGVDLMLPVATVLMSLSRNLHVVVRAPNSCKVSEDTERTEVSEMEEMKYV